MKKVLAITVLVCGIFLVWPEPVKSPEQAVTNAVNQVAEAARRAKPGDFMEPFSEAYEGPEMTHSKLKAFVTRRFLSRGGIAVHLGEIEVQLAPGQKAATARFQATFPSSMKGFAARGDTFTFQVELVLENEGWKIRSQQNWLFSG